MKHTGRKQLLLAALGSIWFLWWSGSVLAMPSDPAPPSPQDPPALFLTVYDWALGGINCDSDCGHTALVPTGPELYGWTAACPVAWLGHITTTVVTIWGGEYWCIDTFGHPDNRKLTEVNGRRVYRIDLAYQPAAEHPWNQELVLFGDWSKEWRPMTEFAALRESRRASILALSVAAGPESSD